MSHGTQPLISIKNVNKFFGAHQVLHNVNLEVFPGEVVIVIGPSGSGKSTLCRCINRLEVMSSGSISLDGVLQPEEGKELAHFRAEVGMVFQSFNLLGLIPRGLPRL